MSCLESNNLTLRAIHVTGLGRCGTLRSCERVGGLEKVRLEELNGFGTFMKVDLSARSVYISLKIFGS